MTRYSSSNYNGGEVIFVCEKCERTDLKEGAEVVIGKRGDEEEFGYGGGTPTGFVYNGISFVVDGDNR